MRVIPPLAALVWTVLAVSAGSAHAQRFVFTQSFAATDADALHVATGRGSVVVEAGTSPAIEVTGTVTVRTAWDVPPNADALARAATDRPPVRLEGRVVRLSVPDGALVRRAVTVSYVVRVPPDMPVTLRSDSGAITTRGVRAPLYIAVQSAAVSVQDAGQVAIASGSGAVDISGTTGVVTVRTESSAIDARAVAGDFQARSGSGRVRAHLVARGDVDVETGSSGVSVEGAAGALDIRSRSGRVTVTGAPSAAWAIATGSGGIDVQIPSGAALTLQATSGSGRVQTAGLGAATNPSRDVSVAVGTAGPAVRLRSRSGAIRVSLIDKS